MAKSRGELQALGLGLNEELVLRCLVDDRTAAVEAIARETGLTQADVTRSMDELQARGFLQRSGVTGEAVLSPPDTVIEALALEREGELKRVRLVAAELGQRFRRLRSGAEPIELLPTRETVLQRYHQLQSAALSEVVAFDMPPYLNRPGQKREPNPVQLDALSRGVSYRIVYDREALVVPGQVETLRVLSDAGERGRVCSGLPMKLLIVDGQRALVPLFVDEPTGDRAVVVQPCALLDALLALFELFWERGRPLDGSPSRPDAAGDEAAQDPMLKLLGAGLTDEVIAHQLGVTSRTVGRRMKRLMDELDVGSRFALGAEAARRGWV